MGNKCLIVLSLLFFVARLVSAQQDKAILSLYEAGNFEQVVEKAEEQIDRVAGDWLLIGHSFQKLGQFENAFVAYDQAKHLGAKKEAQLHRAICHYSMGEYGTSEKLLLKYLNVNSQDQQALYYLAAMRFMTYDIKDALAMCNDIIALNASDMEAHYLRASCYVELNKFEKAHADYRKVLELRPDYHRAKLNLAIVDIETQQYEYALESLQKLIFEDIDFHGEVFYYLAEAKYALHDQDGACEAWKESADLGDEDSNRTYNTLCVEGGKKPKRKSSSAAF